MFISTRIVFYLYYYTEIVNNKIPVSELIVSFWYALPLDISTASYILIFPFLLFVIQSAVFSRVLNRVMFLYTVIVIMLYVLITVGELGVYEEWETKLQFKALNYLSHPDEIYNSADSNIFLGLLFILISEIILFIWLYKKYFYTRILYPLRNYIFTALFLILGSGILFMGIRGGFSEIPITQSKSYFSKYNFVNLASVNSGYSLLISTIENYKFRKENPFSFYDPDFANARVKKLHKVDKDTTISILRVKKPNIVILLLESWSADLIESLGGRTGITPQFRKLESEGLLFTNLYVSGNRSEQAMTKDGTPGPMEKCRISFHAN